ncbi:thiamine diphosphate-binding protein, partial [Baffinella frigidus]
MALQHDMGALRILGDSPHPMTIVVVNNGGGGIFSFLPIAAHADVFEPFFAHPHSLSFEHVAAAFGLRYIRASTPSELDVALRAAREGRGHVLIEAAVSARCDNVQ